MYLWYQALGLPGIDLGVWCEVKGSQFSSVILSCPTPSDPIYCSMPCFPVHHQLPDIAQTDVHWDSDPSSHLILCNPLLLPSNLPNIRGWLLHLRILPSIRVFYSYIFRESESEWLKNWLIKKKTLFKNKQEGRNENKWCAYFYSVLYIRINILSAFKKLAHDYIAILCKLYD